ncbi:OmpA family protein [Ekhidna sp. MALMAid0563]|uniref:OmpA family protein n=1 Tax=Ekhidna sp. MALMAid0563 TaxID=3143937 RepID=UPI0032DE30D9
MKSSIIIFLLTLSLISNAQIAFDGAGVTVESLNTPNGQNYLVINPYQQGLAYTEERGGTPNTSEIYFSEKKIFDDQEWEVLIFPDWLGEKGMTSPIGFTPFGIYYSQVTFDKGMYYGKIYFSSKGSIDEVEIPFFRNKAPIQSGCLSKDGKYMILSMESNNSYGVEDLYIVKQKPDGSWDRAKNLGYQLNTEFQEITPFLAEDNKTLFFATNGRGGQGSFDLFYTVRQDESWRSWREPVNLGAQINTSGAETSFSYLDGSEWAYYVSSQDSDGYGDIMRIRFKEDIEEDTTQIQEPAPIPAQESPVDQVILKIVDAKTKETIPAELIIKEERRIGANGIFEIDSLSGEEIEIKSQGYLPKMVMLDEQLQTGENIISLSSIAKGNVITLDHVLFHRGTANMVDGSEKELNLVVEVMNDNPDIKILLKGHTDNTGDPVKNVQLSEARVKTVKEYIISQGISPYRVSGKGYGGNQPLYSNETEETRKLNRRVEFEVVED